MGLHAGWLRLQTDTGICSSFCFSTATLVTRKPFIITLYVRCLSFCMFILADVSSLTNKHNFDVWHTKCRIVLSIHAGTHESPCWIFDQAIYCPEIFLVFISHCRQMLGKRRSLNDSDAFQLVYLITLYDKNLLSKLILV